MSVSIGNFWTGTYLYETMMAAAALRLPENGCPIVVKSLAASCSVILALVLAQPAAAAVGKPIQAALFINGTLGDRSFFDSAALGLRRAQSELGMETKTVEAGADPTGWEEALTDLVDGGDYDVIVVGTYTLTPLVEKLATAYPETKFIFFDGTVDYGRCACGNVYSVLFRQNEGGYLAGVLAARLALGGAPPTRLGIIGGMDIPVVNDYAAGFEAGAHSVSPDLPVLKQYANSFTDPATGKEIAKAEYGQGADLIFQIAGASGQGVIEAATETGHYVIGVDSDQAAIYQAAAPDRAARIVTSVLKRVDNAVFRALSRMKGGTLAFGKSESLGLKEGAIGLADNRFTQTLVPPATMDQVRQVEAAIEDGSLHVPSVYR